MSTGIAPAGQLRESARAGPSEGAAPVERYLRALQVAIVVVFAFTCWRLAWVSDDALITIRSALNANEGMGPVFNADEHVQAFTHPLWFFVVWASGAVFGSWVYALIYVSLALSVGAVAVLVWRTVDPYRLLFVGTALLISNSMLEWATSGLEGPLVAVLLVGCWFLVRPEWIRSRPVPAGLLVAAVVLTRLDLALIVAIPVGVVVWHFRGDVRLCVRFLLGCAIPVAAWLAWCLIYYGFALPATFDAKTNTSIPKLDVMARGVDYLIASGRFDGAMPVVILAALGLAIAVGTNLARAWMAGVVAYLAYVVWVGGDFMAGRFLFAPLVVSLLVIGTDPWPTMAARRRQFLRVCLTIGALLLVVVAAPRSLLFDSGRDQVEFDGGPGVVLDERGVYAALGQALDPLLDREPKQEYFRSTLGDIESYARDWSYVTTSPSGQTFTACGGLGIVGLVGGPGVHVIDNCGLADRFVASIPFEPIGPWRIGHFTRTLPPGYEEAIRTGNADLVADDELRQELKQLWERIR